MEPTPRTEGKPLTTFLNSFFSGGFGAFVTGGAAILAAGYGLDRGGVISVSKADDLRTEISREQSNLLRQEVEVLRAQLLNRDREIGAWRDSAALHRRASEPAGPVTDTRPSTSARIVEVQAYQLQLQDCTRAGSSVTCSFLVTSPLRNRNFGVGGTVQWGDGIRAVAFSGSGLDHAAIQASLGSSNQDYLAQNLLIQGEPMKASVVFGEVPSDAPALTVVRFAFADEQNRPFPVEFRAVPIRQPT